MINCCLLPVKTPLERGDPDIEKYLDSEFQFPAIGSSTEVLNTATLDTAPSSQKFGQVSSLDQSSIPELTSVPSGKYSSYAQPRSQPICQRPSLSTPKSPGSKLSGVCVPPLLVTLPADQTPPAVLSLNLTPVCKPNKCDYPEHTYHN